MRNRSLQPAGRWAAGLLVLLVTAGVPGAGLADEKPRKVTAAVATKASPKHEVLWGGSWWAAEILERKGGLTKIHYTGWGSEWDEWVEPKRLRQAAARPAGHRGKLGEKIEIEWHGSYWDGEIIEVRGEFHKVHYTGWGSEWDEWVLAERLRARR
jgi:hypothetical protein